MDINSELKRNIQKATLAESELMKIHNKIESNSKDIKIRRDEILFQKEIEVIANQVFA